MHTLTLKSLVSDSSTNEQGFVLFSVFKQAHLKKENIILQIDSDTPMSSSFLNTSIGNFIDTYGINSLKETVKFKCTRNQFTRLSSYIEKYLKTYHT